MEDTKLLMWSVLWVFQRLQCLEQVLDESCSLETLLQSWEVVAAGAQRANAVWHLCWLQMKHWKMENREKNHRSTVGAVFWPHAEGWIPLSYADEECIARSHGMIPCLFPGTCPCKGGDGLVRDNGSKWGRMNVWIPNPFLNNVTQ